MDYKANVGDDISPPTTWDEFARIAQFITEKKGPTVYGSGAMHRYPNVHYLFQNRFRDYGGKFFDPETMKATLNSQAGIDALTSMVALTKSMPSGVEAWGFAEGLTALLNGDIAMWISWPLVARWAQGVNTDIAALDWLPKTKVADKIGYAVPPGGHPELAAGFVYAIASASKDKDAAYLFAQWTQSMTESLHRVQLPVGLRDPYRLSHYNDPAFRALWGGAGEYLDALKAGSAAGVLDLSILNAAAYEDTLARAIGAAIGGADAKETLDGVSSEWDKITETIGVDAQRDAYKNWAAKPNAYFN